MTATACPELSLHAIWITVVNGLVIGMCMNIGFFLVFGAFAKIVKIMKDLRETKTKVHVYDKNNQASAGHLRGGGVDR